MTCKLKNSRTKMTETEDSNQRKNSVIDELLESSKSKEKCMYEEFKGVQYSIDSKKILNSENSFVNQLVPIKYQFAIEAFVNGCANNWMPNEVPMQDDIRDWEQLNKHEKRFILLHLGFIGTAESLIANNIVHSIYKHVTNPDCRQYLLRQAYEEALHTWTFMYINNSLHIDQEVVFNMHRNVKVIIEKDEFAMRLTKSASDASIDTTTTEGIREFVRNLVGYYVIVEGIYFYGGFPMMIAPSHQNKMKGLGKQIEFILRDESVHLGFGIDLINTIFEENPEVLNEEFKQEITDLIIQAVKYEEQYIRYSLEVPVFDLVAEDVIETVKFFANRRLEKLGLKAVFHGAKNKLGYLSTLMDKPSESNFFETINSSYRADKLDF